MNDIVRNYFTNLFSKQVDEAEAEYIDCPRKISEAQNQALIEELRFEEFATAVKQMHPDKASGPDGLNPAFFQTFWNVMGQKVFSVIKVGWMVCVFPVNLTTLMWCSYLRRRMQLA